MADKKEYIERGAFLKKCAEAWGYAGVTIKAIEGIADECTAADVVEVVHGEWIYDFSLDGDDFYLCSVCGRQEVLNGLCAERSPAIHYPYCHCGAKMDGERKDIP